MRGKHSLDINESQLNLKLHYILKERGRVQYIGNNKYLNGPMT
jgi:hypothetical protein